MAAILADEAINTYTKTKIFTWVKESECCSVASQLAVRQSVTAALVACDGSHVIPLSGVCFNHACHDRRVKFIVRITHFIRTITDPRKDASERWGRAPESLIHASDSNLTTGGGNRAGESKKTFAVSYLTAGLTIAGAFSVGGMPMAKWMDKFIAAMDPQGGNLTLRAFAEILGSRLESEMTAIEKSGGSMIHIAGYVEASGSYHPEFYFVRNIERIDPNNGAYEGFKDDFAVDEQFWTQNGGPNNVMEAFESGTYQLYVNGFASGRIGYISLVNYMQGFFSEVWSRPEWKFRPPASLAESVVFVKLMMHFINALFEVSDYPAPFIGGTPQIYEIDPPTAGGP
jgi:hypothetical protein